MAITQVYVDPAINANSGSGTIGAPYGDLQYALDTQARDTTNGNQFNIKAGTSEVLAAALTLATYGTPAWNAPLVIRGYTSAANDGGIGVITGGGSFNLLASNYTSVHWRDMHLTNGTVGAFIDVGTHGSVVNCEVDTGSTLIQLRAGASAIHCYVHDGTNVGISGAGAGNIILGNFLLNGSTNKFARAISINATGSIVGNVIKIDGASIGIHWEFGEVAVLNNTIWSSAGTGTGLDISDTTNSDNGTCLNNVVEGFSGTGGKGILTNANSVIHAIGYNAYYNNATPSTYNGKIVNDYTAFDVALGASPFTSPAGANFAVSTALKALGFPSSFNGASTNTYLDIGAAQRQEPSGGAVSISPTLGSVGAA